MAKTIIREKEFKIKNGEINLDLAAFKLEGEDLKQYKLSVYSRLEADYEHAKDLISELTLAYNKGRQQEITAEILDLVGGMQN